MIAIWDFKPQPGPGSERQIEVEKGKVVLVVKES